MPSKISVIICTHNPDLPRLERVCRALAAQTLPPAQWECILVDNASSPALDGVADMNWHPAGRIVREAGMGLTLARLRGISVSRGDLLVFVDDDNLLDADYLERAVQLMDEHPFLGILGGVGRGEFQKNPPAWMREFLHILGVADHLADKNLPLQYALSHSPGPCVPIGAGLVVRKTLADLYVRDLEDSPERKNLDRTGEGSVSGGGDADLVFTCIDHGFASAVSSQLKFTHIIPEWRIDGGYLERLLYSSNYGVAKLLLLHKWREKSVPEKQTIFPRIKEKMQSLMPMKPANRCWAAFRKGYRDGLSGRPFDRRYRQA